MKKKNFVLIELNNNTGQFLIDAIDVDKMESCVVTECEKSGVTLYDMKYPNRMGYEVIRSDMYREIITTDEGYKMIFDGTKESLLETSYIKDICRRALADLEQEKVLLEKKIEKISSFGF